MAKFIVEEKIQSVLRYWDGKESMNEIAQDIVYTQVFSVHGFDFMNIKEKVPLLNPIQATLLSLKWMYSNI